IYALKYALSRLSTRRICLPSLRTQSFLASQPPSAMHPSSSGRPFLSESVSEWNAAEATMADLLFIVSRTEPKTYIDIGHVFADEHGDVRVILDRRARERRRSRRPLSTERRHRERRHRDVTRESRSFGWAVVRC